MTHSIHFPSQEKWKAFFKRNWFYVVFVALIFISFWKKCHTTDAIQTQASFTATDEPTEIATSPKKTAKKSKSAVPTPLKEVEKQTEVPLSIGAVADNVFTKRKPTTDFVKPDPAAVKIYLEKYRSVAVQEHKKYGLPLSILLGCAIRQSFAGKRDIALMGNNHFGMLCTGEWVGLRVSVAGRCYRSYESVWASFRDHSLYLKQTQFAHLNKLNKTDYKSWAIGLENAGYPEMTASDLIDIIETYHFN
jgi:flagellum-specific peptidoglycan hydrolase FlgJ